MIDKNLKNSNTKDVSTINNNFDELCCGIIEFVHQGIDEGEGIVVIASESTKHALENDLVIYYELQKQLDDRLIILDAESMLSMFMKDKMPDKELFEKAVGGIVRRLLLKKTKVRVYGEMVNILCIKGQHEAAIELEKLWNELIKIHFSFTINYSQGLKYCEKICS